MSDKAQVERGKMMEWNQKMAAASFGMAVLTAPLLWMKANYLEAAFLALIAFGLWRLAFPRAQQIKQEQADG